MPAEKLGPVIVAWKCVINGLAGSGSKSENVE